MNPDLSNCHTGDLILSGSPLPPTSVCGTGTVVGVVNGDIDP